MGLTLLVVPYVRQAAKIQAPPQFLSHTNKARPPRLPSRLPASTAAVESSGSTSTSTEAPAEPAAVEEDPALVQARLFNDREEALLYGPTATDEHGEPVEPVSPWLGFQALGIATALVGLSAGLGIFGAAKYLGVNSVRICRDKIVECSRQRLTADGGVCAEDARWPRRQHAGVHCPGAEGG